MGFFGDGRLGVCFAAAGKPRCTGAGGGLRLRHGCAAIRCRTQFREITSIRINLESLATARTAATIDESGYAEVLALHERFAQEISLKRPDESRLVGAKQQFHFAIYRQAAMPMLMQMIESMWLRVGPIINYDLRKGFTRVTERVAANHHGKLVAALKKKDPVAATKALSADIQGAADFIVSAGVLVAVDEEVASHARWSANASRAKRKGRAGAVLASM